MRESCRGSGKFDLYIFDSDGDLVRHGTFPTWDDAIDGAVDANLPAERMCVVQRGKAHPRIHLVPHSRIPPLEAAMKPAGQ